MFIFTIRGLIGAVLINALLDIAFYNIYYVVAQEEMGEKNLFYFINCFVTDYMLETILFVYYLLFIYTFYLYKLDCSKNNFLLNSQNNDTTISSKKLMNIQSAENYKGFSKTVYQLPEDKNFEIDLQVL